MPIFEYRCECCESVIEKIQTKSEAVTTCPACGNTATFFVSVPAKVYCDVEGK